MPSQGSSSWHNASEQCQHGAATAKGQSHLKELSFAEHLWHTRQGGFQAKALLAPLPLGCLPHI